MIFKRTSRLLVSVPLCLFLGMQQIAPAAVVLAADSTVETDGYDDPDAVDSFSYDEGSDSSGFGLKEVLRADIQKEDSEQKAAEGKKLGTVSIDSIGEISIKKELFPDSYRWTAWYRETKKEPLDTTQSNGTYHGFSEAKTAAWKQYESDIKDLNDGSFPDIKEYAYPATSISKEFDFWTDMPGYYDLYGDPLFGTAVLSAEADVSYTISTKKIKMVMSNDRETMRNLAYSGSGMPALPGGGGGGGGYGPGGDNKKNNKGRKPVMPDNYIEDVNKNIDRLKKADPNFDKVAKKLGLYADSKTKKKKNKVTGKTEKVHTYACTSTTKSTMGSWSSFLCTPPKSSTKKKTQKQTYKDLMQQLDDAANGDSKEARKLKKDMQKAYNNGDYDRLKQLAQQANLIQYYEDGDIIDLDDVGSIDEEFTANDDLVPTVITEKEHKKKKMTLAKVSLYDVYGSQLERVGSVGVSIERFESWSLAEDGFWQEDPNYYNVFGTELEIENETKENGSDYPLYFAQTDAADIIGGKVSFKNLTVHQKDLVHGYTNIPDNPNAQIDASLDTNNAGSKFAGRIPLINFHVDGLTDAQEEKIGIKKFVNLTEEDKETLKEIEAKRAAKKEERQKKKEQEDAESALDLDNFD